MRERPNTDGLVMEKRRPSFGQLLEYGGTELNTLWVRVPVDPNALRHVLQAHCVQSFLSLYWWGGGLSSGEDRL